MTAPTTDATEIIGRPLAEADTPALWIDLDAFEANVATMAKVCRDAGILWRPHVKASKSPELAKRLIEGGATGITCAKLGEAEVMADHGVTDILIANEIVGPIKIRRLIALAARATLCVAADDEQNIREIADAASAAGVTVELLVDINVGANRCGVAPADAPRLAQLVLELPGLALRGLMGYEGHVMGVSDVEEKEAQSAAAADTLAEAREALRAAGIEPRILSGGGTGNYWIAARLGSINELQAGGGVLLDLSYAEGMKVPGHRHALFLDVQVISTAAPGRAIADAGWKTTGMHTGLPRVAAPEGLEVLRLNAEHTIMQRSDGAAVRAGDRVTLIPHYSDSTVLLHRRLYAVRRGVVEAVWPVAAAGMLQ